MDKEKLANLGLAVSAVAAAASFVLVKGFAWIMFALTAGAFYYWSTTMQKVESSPGKNATTEKSLSASAGPKETEK